MSFCRATPLEKIQKYVKDENFKVPTECIAEFRTYTYHGYLKIATALKATYGLYELAEYLLLNGHLPKGKKIGHSFSDDFNDTYRTIIKIGDQIHTVFCLNETIHYYVSSIEDGGLGIEWHQKPLTDIPYNQINEMYLKYKVQ